MSKLLYAFKISIIKNIKQKSPDYNLQSGLLIFTFYFLLYLISSIFKPELIFTSLIFMVILTPTKETISVGT